MHIDIDGAGLERDKQRARRVSAGEQRVSVRLLDRRLQQRRLYESAVAVKILHTAVASAQCGRGHEACDLNAVAGPRAREHGACDITTQKRVYGGVRSAVAGGEENLLAVFYAFYRHLGSAEGAAQCRCGAGGRFTAVGFQKFQASGRVVEKITHGDARALRAAAGAHVDYIACLHGDSDALGSALFTGRELNA